MSPKPNAQYNLAAPNSLADQIGVQVRRRMYNVFMDRLAPTGEDTVLDIGASSDQSYRSSNYFEALYPYKDRITAAGIDDAAFLESLYPGLRFVRANALEVPFADGSFDLVHSSAVLEHVGSFESQAQMVSECLRLARRGICLTTPNRWFPIEFHTQLPLIHWLPKPAGRALMQTLGYDFFAREENLNLMTRSELQRITERYGSWRFEIASTRLLGLPSNLLLLGYRNSEVHTRDR